MQTNLQIYGKLDKVSKTLQEAFYRYLMDKQNVTNLSAKQNYIAFDYRLNNFLFCQTHIHHNMQAYKYATIYTEDITEPMTLRPKVLDAMIYHNSDIVHFDIEPRMSRALPLTDVLLFDEYFRRIDKCINEQEPFKREPAFLAVSNP